MSLLSSCRVIRGAAPLSTPKLIETRLHEQILLLRLRSAPGRRERSGDDVKPGAAPVSSCDGQSSPKLREAGRHRLGSFLSENGSFRWRLTRGPPLRALEAPGNHGDQPSVPRMDSRSYTRTSLPYFFPRLLIHELLRRRYFERRWSGYDDNIASTELIHLFLANRHHNEVVSAFDPLIVK